MKGLEKKKFISFIPKEYSILWIHYNWFICSTGDKSWAYFQFYVIINKDAPNSLT